MEKTWTKATLWLPTLPLTKMLVWSRWDPDDGEHADDEDPGNAPSGFTSPITQSDSLRFSV